VSLTPLNESDLFPWANNVVIKDTIIPKAEIKRGYQSADG